MPKSVVLPFVLSLVLVCAGGAFEMAMSEEPLVADQIVSKDTPTDRPTSSRLIHRRYLRIPTRADSENRTIVISVGDEEVKRLDASLAMTSAESFTEFDVSQWMGAVVKLESLSGADADGAKLFSLVSQSNQQFKTGWNPVQHLIVLVLR